MSNCLLTPLIVRREIERLLKIELPEERDIASSFSYWFDDQRDEVKYVAEAKAGSKQAAANFHAEDLTLSLDDFSDRILRPLVCALK